MIRLILPKRNFLVFEEPPLNTEPLRPDIVVVKRTKSSKIKPVLLVPEVERLGKITIIHFSGPTDELQSSDALELLAYMAQYCRAEGVNPDDGLVLMVVANKITPRFFQAIVARGGELQQSENGLWSGHLSLVPLHVVETSVRAGFETERLLYTLSAQVIVNPHIVGQMSNQEAQVLQLLYGYFKQLHQQGRLDMAQSSKIVERTFEEIAKDFNKLLPVSARLEGVDVKDRLEGVDVKDRLEGVDVKEVVTALGPEQTLLGLPDEVLRALSPDYISTLSEQTQKAIAARLNPPAKHSKKSTAKKKH